MIPRSFFKAHGRREQLPVRPPPGRRHEVSRVPLDRGDALVLRQVEIHRTDRMRVRPGEWRLGIGFKVLAASPLVRRPLAGKA